jgi:mono/diheme cytochrome c family protein
MMNQTTRYVAGLGVAGWLLLAVGPACAAPGKGFGVTGSGDRQEIDPTTLPRELQPGHALLKKHCAGCHSQERIIFVLHNCRSKLTGEEYCENSLKDKIGRMIRQPGTSLGKQDARTLFDFLVALRRLVTG